MKTFKKVVKKQNCRSCRLQDKKGRIIKQPVPPAVIDVSKI